MNRHSQTHQRNTHTFVNIIGMCAPGDLSASIIHIRARQNVTERRENRLWSCGAVKKYQHKQINLHLGWSRDEKKYREGRIQNLTPHSVYFIRNQWQAFSHADVTRFQQHLVSAKGCLLLSVAVDYDYVFIQLLQYSMHRLQQIAFWGQASKAVCTYFKHEMWCGMSGQIHEIYLTLLLSMYKHK